MLGINESNFYGIVEELEARGIKVFGDCCKGRTSILTNMSSWTEFWCPGNAESRLPNVAIFY